MTEKWPDNQINPDSTIRAWPERPDLVHALHNLVATVMRVCPKAIKENPTLRMDLESAKTALSAYKDTHL